MPLASSRAAIQKRAAEAQKKKEEAERRNRLSLPKTIKSTTRVTRDSVKRRRNSRVSAADDESVKKQKNDDNSTKAIQEVDMAVSPSAQTTPPEALTILSPTPYWKVAKERGGPKHFSPPVTRSSKKKKPPLAEARPPSGVVLTFSPPDQQLNVQREKEQLQKEAHEHKGRVAQAKDEGRFLEFSPNSFRCRNFNMDVDNVEDNDDAEDEAKTLADDEEHTEVEANIKAEESPASNTQMSDMTSSKTHQTTPEMPAEIKTMKGQITEHDWELEKQVQLKLLHANDKFNEKNEALAKKLSESKETFLVETTKLKAELEFQQRESSLRVHSLEVSSQKLENQVSELKEELRKKKQKITELEEELKISKKSNETESHAMEDVMQRLQMVKQSEESLLREKKVLENDLKAMNQVKEDLRESDTLLQSALKKVKQQEEEAAKTKEDLERHDSSIKELQTTIALLQTQKNDYEVTNQELSETIKKLHEELEKKELKIDQLTNEVGKINCLNQEKSGFQVKISELELKLAENDRLLQQAAMQLDSNKQQERETKQELEKQQEQLSERVRNQQLRIMMLEKQLQTSMDEHKETKSQLDGVAAHLETFDDRENSLYHKLHESERIRQSLHARVMELSGNIRVFCRVRPLTQNEMNAPALVDKKINSKRIKERSEPAKDETPWYFPGDYGDRSGMNDSAGVGADLTKKLVEITEPYKDRGGLSDRRKKWRFGFDHVFPPSASQQDIWEASEPLVQSAVDGYNVTIFAYGQTGSGKTYTMLGEETNKGIIARSVEKMFHAKQELEALHIKRGGANIKLSVELIEIYNEEVRDLLSTSPVSGNKLKVTSNDIVGNTVVQTETEDEVMQVLGLAQGRRCVKATESNAESSRSHMLFTLHFEASLPGGITRSGKLNVCDLAGSERLGKSGANAVVGGDLLKETKCINSSLSVLSNVIEKLQAGSSSIPYRESKLTFLLQNSLSGNSKTLAIVCCNPHVSHFHESLCSLRFAAKVNKVDLKAVANFSA